MLDSVQTQCLTDFFKYINELQAIRIASSVLNGKIQPKTKLESLNMIILHTCSIYNVFYSKKVGTTMLRQYLLNIGIAADINASKMDLILMVTRRWNIPEPDAAIPLIPQATLGQLAHINQQLPMNYNVLMPPPSISNNNSLSSGVSPTSLQSAMDTAFTLNCATPQVSPEDSPPTINGNNSINIAMLSHDDLKNSKELMFNHFVVDFASKYYTLLNQTGPDSYCKLNSDYLFDTCSMEVIIYSNGNDNNSQKKEQATGINNVMLMLMQLKKQFNLHLEPNLTEQGVRGKLDVHGMLCAIVCGMLHQGPGQLVGMFEQSFVLTTDPFANNSIYKITKSTLVLRNSIPPSSGLALPSSFNNQLDAIMDASEVNNVPNDRMLTYGNSTICEEKLSDNDCSVVITEM